MKRKNSKLNQNHRISASQAEGRGFEPRFPLWLCSLIHRNKGAYFFTIISFGSKLG